jgi:integrase
MQDGSEWSGTYGAGQSVVSGQLSVATLEPPGTTNHGQRTSGIGPDEDAAELPARPRWSDLWGLYRRKRLVERGRPAGTIESQDESARLFGLAVGDPLLEDICEGTLLDFAGYLARRKWRGKLLSGRTQSKHLTQVGTVLRYGGPRQGGGRRCKRTACRCGLFVPPVLCSDDWPATIARKKGTLLVEQITAWIDACSIATRPRVRHVSAKAWWAALLLWLRNTGMRIEETLELRWEWIDGPWVTVPADSRKGRAAEHRLYANQWARAAAWRIRTGGDLVFGYRGSQNNLHHLVRLYSPSKACRMHRLRATLSTDLIAAGHEMVARMQLGHRGGVTQEHYANFERIAPRVMEDAAILPQPDLRWDPAYQRFLTFAQTSGEQPSGAREPVPNLTPYTSHLTPSEDPGQLRLF